MRGSTEGELTIDPSRLAGIFEFVQAAERLKDTLRTGRTRLGRAESTAEHTWRLCLMAMLFDRELAGIDQVKLLRLLVVHDLGEAISGDVPATEQRQGDDRAGRERADLISICSPLPDDVRDMIVEHWDDYAGGSSPEAVLAKGLDKIETMMQHLVGLNAPHFDYAFNLTYGRPQTDKHPLLSQLRGIVDTRTEEKLQHSAARPTS